TTSSQSVTIATNGFTRTGYNFSSWNTAADGSGTSYDPGDSYNPSVAYNATTLCARHGN
ncbi:MAG: InlB B-repeat-containing protein, partial [Clostridia bacterium]|nr:InlB B-repeat-containing protein [Clostridia bacterium]